ncbi:MAG: T9SS type A sorting domain-containing protein, partial [Paludibacteraceae bacterium]|nr:T9SS type A sorting domain-containing protein [Paludibacteraceae bacterium]
SVSVLDTAIGNIELSFFGTENFTRPVYLYDALTDINTEIYSGMKIDFDGREPDAVRYYLNIDRSDVITFNDDVDNDNDVIISSDNKGLNILSKSELKSVAVYDIAGHLIDKYHNIYNTTFEIYLPVGVYVVEIETENGVSNNKVIVK